MRLIFQQKYQNKEVRVRAFFVIVFRRHLGPEATLSLMQRLCVTELIVTL